MIHQKKRSLTLRNMPDDCKIVDNYEKMGGYLWNIEKYLNGELSSIIIVTQKTAPDVAFHLLEILTSQEKTIEVKKTMGY